MSDLGLTRLPKIIVFDLDYTLWPFWVDTHVVKPFRLDKNKHIFDAAGHRVRCFTEVDEVLQNLKKNHPNVSLGVASRTSEVEGAKSLLTLFGWMDLFTFVEIYPGSKVAHFQKIHQLSGVGLRDMLFFDDEERNIRDVSKLGVTCVLVKNGVSHAELQRGLEAFSKN